MVQVVWTKIALRDLKSIHDFIAEDSSFYAKRYILKILDLTDVLRSFPLSGRVVPEWSDESMRELIHGNYRIFYRIGKASEKIFIVRVHHAARIVR